MMHATILSLLVVALSLSATSQEYTGPSESSTTAKVDPTGTTEHPVKTTATSKTTAQTQSTSGESRTTAGFTSESTTSSLTPTTMKPLPGDVYAVKSHSYYCILLKANITIDVTYNSTKEKKLTTQPVNVPPPTDVTVNGSCGTAVQNINIFFHDWILTFTFQKEGSKYYQSHFSLYWNFNFTDAPNITDTTSSDVHVFETSKDGYLCTAKQTIYKNSSVTLGITGIFTKNLKLEAFQNKTEPSSMANDHYERCSEDNISNLVPIIVGACLGGLIIIVLIAYLIGRKRSRRGYESV